MPVNVLPLLQRSSIILINTNSCAQRDDSAEERDTAAWHDENHQCNGAVPASAVTWEESGQPDKESVAPRRRLWIIKAPAKGPHFTVSWNRRPRKPPARKNVPTSQGWLILFTSATLAGARVVAPSLMHGWTSVGGGPIVHKLTSAAGCAEQALWARSSGLGTIHRAIKWLQAMSPSGALAIKEAGLPASTGVQVTAQQTPMAESTSMAFTC